MWMEQRFPRRTGMDAMQANATVTPGQPQPLDGRRVIVDENALPGWFVPQERVTPIRLREERRTSNRLRLRHHFDLAHRRLQIARIRFRLRGAEVMVEHFTSLTLHLGNDALGRFGRGSAMCTKRATLIPETEQVELRESWA